MSEEAPCVSLADRSMLQERHARGGPCNFQELPLEIRNMIYRYCLVRKVSPKWSNRARKSQDKVMLAALKGSTPFPNEFHTGILYVNRRINVEASKIFYGDNTFIRFRIPSSRTFMQLLRKNMNSPGGHGMLFNKNSVTPHSCWHAMNVSFKVLDWDSGYYTFLMVVGELPTLIRALALLILKNAWRTRALSIKLEVNEPKGWSTSQIETRLLEPWRQLRAVTKGVTITGNVSADLAASIAAEMARPYEGRVFVDLIVPIKERNDTTSSRLANNKPVEALHWNRDAWRIIYTNFNQKQPYKPALDRMPPFFLAKVNHVVFKALINLGRINYCVGQYHAASTLAAQAFDMTRGIQMEYLRKNNFPCSFDQFTDVDRARALVDQSRACSRLGDIGLLRQAQLYREAALRHAPDDEEIQKELARDGLEPRFDYDKCPRTPAAMGFTGEIEADFHAPSDSDEEDGEGSEWESSGDEEALARSVPRRAAISA